MAGNEEQQIVLSGLEGKDAPVVESAVSTVKKVMVGDYGPLVTAGLNLGGVIIQEDDLPKDTIES